MANERLYGEYTSHWFGGLGPISLTLAITWPQVANGARKSNYGGGSGEWQG